MYWHCLVGATHASPLPTPPDFIGSTLLYLLDLRIKGIPVTFLVVLLLTVLLSIFFGAWAVSADVEAQERMLGLSAIDPNPGGATSGTSTESTEGDSPGQEDAGTLADEWWGDALLKVCPFH